MKGSTSPRLDPRIFHLHCRACLPEEIILRLFVLLAALLIATGASAAGLIRDAEIEQTLRRIASPIFRAAMLTPATVHIYIVNDREMNAFVAGGQNIFITTGLLTRLETIDQLRAVIAHETGHIAGGHLTRRNEAMKGSRGVAMIGMIGAAAAAVGGSPQAGMAIAMGSQQAAQRSALAYSRSEEAAADQAGLRFVASAGGDPRAILEVLRLFGRQRALMTAGMDPYAQTHPMWSDRLAMLEARVEAMPEGTPPSAEDVYWHARMVAKLKGFLDPPARTLAQNPVSDGSEMASLSRAIAWHLRPDVGRGLAETERLIAMRPDDPFYLELKGQFLLESGEAGPAVAAYRAAAAAAPKEALILAGLGRALLNTDDPAATAEARDILERSARLDRANPATYRDLALAEARLGHEGLAALATAERFLLEGRAPDAYRNAARAVDLLPAGSPGWRRAQDVIVLTRRQNRSTKRQG